MDDEDLPDDADSTLVRSGKTALTFTEMTAFVKDIESRPPERLVHDLPGLMALPEAKYSLVVMVLRKKIRPRGPERSGIIAQLTWLRTKAESPEVRQRAEAFLARAD